MSRRAAIYALGVIFVANFFNYIDRQLVSALEEPLTDAFRLSAKEFGLLWTLFTIGYMLCAMPIGLAADRWSRTRLFAVCIVVWSVATVASGMAQAKWILYVARIFIGVGEAGCLVIGPSLISDYFDKSVRGKALSVFYLGLPLGGTAAFIMAGALLDIGWRNLFYIAGVPGFLIAALIWTLREPRRGAGEGSSPGATTVDDGAVGGHGHGGARAGAREYAALLKNRTLFLIIFAQTFAVIILIPLIHFGVEFFIDARGMGKKEARIALGLIALVAGALGNSLSGVIGDKLSKRGVKGAYALMAGVAFLAGWPCLLVGFYAHSRWVFIPAITLGCFFYFLCMPAVNTQIANVTRPAQRSTAWAMAVFVLHLFGDMLAPVIFGAVDDRFKVSYGVDSRQHAFAIFSFSLLLAGACCLIGSRTARRDEERAASETRIKTVT